MPCPASQKKKAYFIIKLAFFYYLQVKENGEWKDIHSVTDNKENLYYANMDTPVVGDNFRL